MTEYYTVTQNLMQELDIAEVEASISTPDDTLWVEGNKFSAAVPQQQLSIDTQYGQKLADFFDTTVPLMSQRLVEILLKHRVDNIDTYPMILVWPDGTEEQTPFFAVNVIGCLDAIDFDNSDYEQDVLMFRFRKLVIDPQKVGELKCFRLNELENYIVVSEDIAKAIVAAQLVAVQVTPVKDFRDRLAT